MGITIPEGFASAAWVHTGSAGTSPYVFTLGLDINGVEDQLPEIGRQLVRAWSHNLAALVSNELTLEKVVLTVGLAGGLTGNVDSDLPTIPGERTGASQPVSEAVIINKLTGIPGRQYKGRMFMPGWLATGDVSLEGVMNDSTIDDFQAAVEAFFTEVVNGSTEPGSPAPVFVLGVLLHEVSDIDPTLINGLTVSSKVGILRKRLR